jgi:transcription factor 1
MKPSLEKHIGCDILDLNPGPGIWSSTLHDFLKPRTHILMEPDHAFYKPLLQPLIDAEGSTYKFIPKSGVVWASLQEALSSELLPHQEVLQNGDPRLEAPNDTLLLVANLGYNPRKPYRGFPSITNLVLHQLLSAARSHALVHKYGLVRMLIWVDNEEKKMVLPRTIQLRRKAAVEAEVTCGHIAEVASSTDPAGYMRDPNLDLESSIAVLGRMKDSRINTPKDRQGDLEIEAAQSISGGDGAEASLKRTGHKRLDDLERQFAAGEFSMFQDTPEGRLASEVSLNPVRLKLKSPEWDRMALLIHREKMLKTRGFKFHYGDELRRLQEGFATGEFRKYTALENDYGGPGKIVINKHYTPEYRTLNTLRIMQRGVDGKKAKAAALAAEYEAIISMCKQVRTLEGPAAMHLQQKIDTSYKLWKENMALVKQSDTLGMIYYMMDNHIAFSQNPPILYWDRRKAEPIKAEPEEFFPGTEMALLDFQPRPLWPILREDFPANYDVLEFILSNLLVSPLQSVREGISSLAPGAFEYLIPECPSITDARKGGSPFLDTMTVRSLSLEMYQELLEAWLKWPFRPSRYELLSKMGSDVYDPEFGDLDLPESG